MSASLGIGFKITRHVTTGKGLVTVRNAEQSRGRSTRLRAGVTARSRHRPERPAHPGHPPAPDAPRRRPLRYASGQTTVHRCKAPIISRTAHARKHNRATCVNGSRAAPAFWEPSFPGAGYGALRLSPGKIRQPWAATVSVALFGCLSQPLPFGVGRTVIPDGGQRLALARHHRAARGRPPADIAKTTESLAR